MSPQGYELVGDGENPLAENIGRVFAHVKVGVALSSAEPLLGCAVGWK